MKEYYTKENLERIIKESLSFADALRKIGLASKGGNCSTLKKYVMQYNIDTTHFSGQRWNKGLAHTNKTSLTPIGEILKENTNFKSHYLKLRLVSEGLKEYKCEKCGCNGEWLGKPITLELHHINGNHYDNRIENLQILCPNCHSQTPNHRCKKNISNIPKPMGRKGYECACQNCGKTFKADRATRKFCSRECYNDFLMKNKIG